MNQEFVKIASTEEVTEGMMKTVNLGEEQVLLVNVERKIHAIRSICTHAGLDLSEGELEGDKVVCAGHGAKWDLNTGNAVFNRSIPPEPVYETKVEGSELYVRRK